MYNLICIAILSRSVLGRKKPVQEMVTFLFSNEQNGTKWHISPLKTDVCRLCSEKNHLIVRKYSDRFFFLFLTVIYIKTSL